MTSNRAVTVVPSKPDRLVISAVGLPQPQRNEAVVRVHAFSINRGEIRRSATAPEGFRPGWDFAGVVEQSAADGGGPVAGTRVVGMINPTNTIPGAWAEHIAAPTHAIAALPDAVSFEVASTLPVAGLTALHSLYKGGFLLGKKVLVTGATGGTGDFTIQLAKLAGATVVALCRSADRAENVRRSGADYVVVGDDPSGAAALGPYHLIVDSVGGSIFGPVTAMLAPRGVHVVFGTSAGGDVTFAANKLYPIGMASIYGLILFSELQLEPASVGLDVLSRLVADGKLKPRIEITQSWKKIGEVSRQLTERSFVGKAGMIVD